MGGVQGRGSRRAVTARVALEFEESHLSSFLDTYLSNVLLPEGVAKEMIRSFEKGDALKLRSSLSANAHLPHSSLILLSQQL